MVRIGIVGAGGMGHQHASQLAEHPEVSITGVVEPDSERSQAFIESFGGESYDSVASMLDAVDGAYVLTPPRQRVELVRTLATAGKAIFCEKPLAATVEDGEEIARIADEAGVPFMVGFMRRFATPMQDLKALVDSGRLGRILHVSRTRMGYLLPPTGNWRVDRTQRCGMTIESVSHDIDLLRWLVGDVDHAAGEVTVSRAELPGFDDTMAATMRFASGTIGSLQVSWRSHLQHNSCNIVGTRGAALVDGPGMWTSERLRVRWEDAPEDQETRYGPQTADDMGFPGETREFLRLLRGDPSAGATVADGVAALRVSEAILRSSNDRRMLGGEAA